MKRCEAKTRNGGLCQKYAMENGRCKLHGGKSLRGPAHPNYKNGLYAKDTPEKYREKAERFIEADPFDLASEIALLRTLLAEYFSRFEHANLDQGAIFSMSQLVSEISKVAERLSRIKNETALTGAEIALLEMRISGAITRYIDDPAKRKAFIREIFGIDGGAPLITDNTASIQYSSE